MKAIKITIPECLQEKDKNRLKRLAKGCDKFGWNIFTIKKEIDTLVREAADSDPEPVGMKLRKEN